MIDDVGALRQCLDDHRGTDRSNADDVWAEIVRIATDGPAVGVCTVATARRERDAPAEFAAQIPSRLVMQLADPSGYTSFGFRPIDLPRFVAGRALDPVDRVELQIAEAPAALADAIAALAAEPAGVRPPAGVGGTVHVTRRGDGIGLEVTTSVVRGVRLDQDEPGRVVAAAEAPISRFDDEAAVLDALVRVHGQLGDVAGIHAATTRAAWFPVGSTMQRLDATGHTGPELNSMRHDLAERAGITSTMLIEAQARRWMLVLRWDHVAASRLERLLERAGFVDASVEPAPVAFGRVIGTTTPVARRDASNGHSWAAVFDAGVPIAATSVPQASREYPGMAVAAAVNALHRLDDVLGAPGVGRPRRRDRRHRDRVHREVRRARNCSSCSPKFRIPRSLPTTCARRSAKRWRSVPPLEPPGWPDGSDRSTSSPRPARRAPPTPGGRGRSSGSSSSHRAYAPSRQPWWRRFGPLAQSRSRKPGRSPKTATAWRSGTKSRR